MAEKRRGGRVIGFMWSADVGQTRGDHEELLEIAVYGLCQGRVRTVGEKKVQSGGGGFAGGGKLEEGPHTTTH